jgi:hypothetical protein
MVRGKVGVGSRWRKVNLVNSPTIVRSGIAIFYQTYFDDNPGQRMHLQHPVRNSLSLLHLMSVLEYALMFINLY